MLTLEKITADRFDEVYVALMHEVAPEVPEAHWRRTFTLGGNSDDDCRGFALADGGDLVGMLGTIFSTRHLNGRALRFCNLHCWYVKPEYRAQSLMLMRPVLALKDHTITDLTPSVRVAGIAKRLGFATLDRGAMILPPVAWGARHGHGADAVIVDAAQHRELLQDADRRIFDDHQDIDCGHLLVRGDDSYCYVVYSTVDRHRLPYCLVHYVSDRRMLAEHHGPIRSQLMANSGGRYVAVASRMLAGVRVPFSFRLRANEQLYRSKTTTPEQIDSLYSEIVCLKNSLFPGFVQRMRGTMKSWLPERARRLLPKPA